MRVALTGNIGSGKTTVAKKFEALGIPVFYADDEAKKFYKDPKVIKKITNLFGNEILTNNKINFKKLAEIIFSDGESLKELNQIIHPLVMNEYNIWHEKQDIDYTILESAIIFENELSDKFHKVILVGAPVDLRIQRVINRDGVTEEEVSKRMRHQIDEGIKRNFSDLFINNDGPDLDIQIKEVDDYLMSLIWKNCPNCEWYKKSQQLVGSNYFRCFHETSHIRRPHLEFFNCEYWENKKLERRYKLKRLKNVRTR